MKIVSITTYTSWCISFVLLHYKWPQTQQDKTQFPFISSIVLCGRSLGSWSLCLDFHRLKAKCWSQCALFWRAWGESTSRIIQIVGRIQFLACVRQKSSFLCWLLARVCSQQQEPTLQFFHVAPSIFKVINSAPNPSCALTLSNFLFCHQLVKTFCF